MDARATIPLLICLGAAPPVFAQTAPERSDLLALTNVTVIDGTGAPPRPHMTVLVNGSMISGIFPAADAPIPASAEVVDLSGQYLIPGLINTHIHLPMLGWTRDSVAAGLERMLRAGVTTVREMAGDTRLSAELQRAVLLEAASLPNIHYAVRMAGPTFYSPARPTDRAWIGYAAGAAPWAQAVTAETDIARAVAMALGTGATGLKLYADLDVDVVRRLVAEAHRQGLKTWAHGTVFPTGPLDAVRAGIDGLSHICFLFWGLQPTVAASMAERVPFGELVDLEGGPFQELLREMRAREVVLDATARNASQNPGARAAGCTPDLLNRSLRAAHRAGVRLSTGTDYVIADGDPDPTLFTEIEYLVAAGVLSPLEAITAATLNGARAIGIEERYGTIEVGKVADLLVLADDPTTDINALQGVVTVFREGRQVSQRVPSDHTPGDNGVSIAGPTAADTIRFTVIIDGHAKGERRMWQESPGRWRFEYEGDPYDSYQFPRTERLVLDADGLPVQVEIRGEDGRGTWEERFERKESRARWSTVTRWQLFPFDPPDLFGGDQFEEVGRQSADTLVVGVAYYAAVYPVHDVGVAARALLRQADRSLPLLPAGKAHLETLGDRAVDVGGRSRRVHHYAVHGLDLRPVYVWLDEDGTTFADEWSIRAGWESVFPELRSATEQALADHHARLAEALVPPARERPLVIRGARLFDAESGTTRPDVTIVVEGNQIAAVGADGSVDLPPDAEVIDATGLSALPGLWDMHAHHGIPSLYLELDAPLHLAGGITTARDLGSHTGPILSLRSRIESGEALGPRLLLSGFIDGPGRRPSGVLVGSVAEARAAVDRFADLGYVQIKIYGQVPPDLLLPLIERARAHGMRVSGHVPEGMNLRDAVEAGFEEIQHADYIFMNLADVPDLFEDLEAFYEDVARLTADPVRVRELVELLVTHDVAVDPTLTILDSWSRVPHPWFDRMLERLPPQARRRVAADQGFRFWPVHPLWDQIFDNVLDIVRQLHEAGVPVLPGSDMMPGIAVHRELELYVQAGIPAPEALTLATLGAARLMGMDGELGSIETGKLADLILVDGDPTVDISDIRRVVMVIRDGRVYDPAAIYRALGVEP